MSTFRSHRTSVSCSFSQLCQLRQCALASEWSKAAELLDETGRCYGCMEFVVHKAVQEQQWDLVPRLVELGVPSALRNSLLQSAMAHRHVRCTAKLIDLGVNKHCREDGIRQEIASGHVDFILGVVKTVKDPDLTDFVLRESVMKHQWHLVSELVKEGLSMIQMEHVCKEAVTYRQWTLVLQLLRDDASPSEWIVDRLFENNMAHALLDLFPAGSVNEGLKGLLLKVSVKHGLGDFTLLIIQRESVKDRELMEAMKYAVHHMDKTVLLKLIRHCPRSRRVFKQLFVHQHWNVLQCDGMVSTAVSWLFMALYEGEEKDLALHVAASTSDEKHLIVEFCHCERNRFDLKQMKFRYALRKLHDYFRYGYLKFTEELYQKLKIERSKSDCSFLFCHAIRREEYTLLITFCKHGVSRKDLRFAASWLLLGDHEHCDIFFQLCRCLGSKDRKWLHRYAVRLTMKEYFTQMSNISLETLIKVLTGCSVETNTRYMYREAIEKCLEFDRGDCYVRLCQEFVPCNNSYLKDRLSDYSSAIQNRPHFISRVCKEHIAFSDRSVADELFLLLFLVIEEEAWNVLPDLSLGAYESFFSEVFEMLDICVREMLCNSRIWAGIAPALDQWIRETNPRQVQDVVKFARVRTNAEQGSSSVSDVKQWCVDNGHANLAFFLAMVAEDWELVETLLTTDTRLDLHHGMLRGSVYFAADSGEFSAGVAMLRIYPMNAEMVRMFRPFYSRRMTLLAKACKDRGLLDWALVLQSYKWPYIRENHEHCQNHIVLDFLLEKSVKDREWDMTRDLMERSSDSRILEWVLHRAMVTGHVDIVKALIGRVDPSTCFIIAGMTFFVVVVSSIFSADVKMKMIHLCIESGLSTFQRYMQLEENTNLRNEYCPISQALDIDNVEIIEIMLACGAASYKRLYEIADNTQMQSKLISTNLGATERWKAGYRCILKAASVPSPLLHMARLVVSHSIGCRPGRSKRIESLPVAKYIKDLLMFRDVLSTLGQEISVKCK